MLILFFAFLASLTTCCILLSSDKMSSTIEFKAFHVINFVFHNFNCFDSHEIKLHLGNYLSADSELPLALHRNGSYLMLSATVDKLANNSNCENNETTKYFVYSCILTLHHRNEQLQSRIFEVTSKDLQITHSLLLPLFSNNETAVIPHFLKTVIKPLICIRDRCKAERSISTLNIEINFNSEMRVFNVFVSKAYMIMYHSGTEKRIMELIDVSREIDCSGGLIKFENNRFPDKFDLFLEFLLEKRGESSELSAQVAC